MFREMRRKNQLLDYNASLKILEQGSSGVLALLGDDDYPYAVPLSYAYSNGKIYFHAAKEGHKIDAVKKCNKASFCIIEQDLVAPKEYTTYFRSVIAFGKIKIIENETEKRNAIELLAKKYHPTDTEEGRLNAINMGWNHLLMIELEIEHLTGKEAKELVNKRKSISE